MDEILGNPHNLYTPKELLMQGASFEKPETPRDWNVPLAIKMGADKKTVANLRKESGPFSSFVLISVLKESGRNAVVNVEEMNIETGRTIRDPRIGLIRKIGDEEKFVEIPEWTRTVEEALSKINEDIVWRRNVEGQAGSESKG